MHDLLTINPERLANVFKMDLHHLVRGKVLYVMIAIAVFIPVMMLTQMDGANDLMAFVGVSAFPSAEAPGGTFGAGMSLSMLNVLTGILLCIYIGSDYKTGFIKSIVAAHANKYDYIISKALVALVCNIALLVAYLAALFIVGSAMGVPTGMASLPGLAQLILEKLILSVPMSLLVIALNMVFRRSYGWSIAATCLVASGMMSTGAQMGLRMLGLDAAASMLNFTISGASAFFASATFDPLGFLMIVLVGGAWALALSVASDCLMNRLDLL